MRFAIAVLLVAASLVGGSLATNLFLKEPVLGRPDDVQVVPLTVQVSIHPG